MLAAIVLANGAVVSLGGALLMVVLGTQKKLLRWKRAPTRCPACGRTDRRGCACRR